MKQDEQEDGEIWSAALWSIHELIGGKKADQLILQSHYLVRPGKGTFSEGAQAILAANKDLFAAAKEAEIRQIFIDRGILDKP